MAGIIDFIDGIALILQAVNRQWRGRTEKEEMFTTALQEPAMETVQLCVKAMYKNVEEGKLI